MVIPAGRFVMKLVTILAVIVAVLGAMACELEEPELVATPGPTATATATTAPSPTLTPEPTAKATATATPSSTLTPEPTATPKIEPKTFNVGDTVRLGDLEITVNGVRVSFGNDFWAPNEGNYFIYVDVTFTNRGDQPEVLSTLLQMTLQDAQSFQYSVDFTAISASNVPRRTAKLLRVAPFVER